MFLFQTEGTKLQSWNTSLLFKDLSLLCLTPSRLFWHFQDSEDNRRDRKVVRQRSRSRSNSRSRDRDPKHSKSRVKHGKAGRDKGHSHRDRSRSGSRSSKKSKDKDRSRYRWGRAGKKDGHPKFAEYLSELLSAWIIKLLASFKISWFGLSEKHRRWLSGPCFSVL